MEAKKKTGTARKPVPLGAVRLPGLEPTTRAEMIEVAEVIQAEADSQLERDAATRAWELSQATRALVDALTLVESAFVKYGPKVPPGGPQTGAINAAGEVVQVGEADAFIRLRAALPDPTALKALAVLAHKQTQEMQRLCRRSYQEPNPELRDKSALEATRALLANAGWTGAEIAKDELLREGPAFTAKDLSRRVNTVKQTHSRLRQR